MKKEFGGKDKESQIRGVYQGDVARTIKGSGESQLTVAIAECRAGDEAEADVAMCAGVGRMRCVLVKEGWPGMRRKATGRIREGGATRDFGFHAHKFA